MRVITSACFGFALAASAFALSSAPASAFEIPSVTGITPNHVIKVYDEDRREYREREERHEERERRERAEREARERREHCEHARRECGERHGYDRREFHVERRGCGR
jgi:hypothetical protein